MAKKQIKTTPQFKDTEFKNLLVKGRSKYGTISGGQYGKYSVVILLDPDNPEDAEIIAQLEEWDTYAMKRIKEELASIPKVKAEEYRVKKPWGEDLDDNYEPTGYLALRVKTNRLGIWDAKLKAIPPTKLRDGSMGWVIGSGAEVAADIKLKLFATADMIGYTAYLNGLQVIKKGKGRDTNTPPSSFGVIEDGYSVEDDPYLQTNDEDLAVPTEDPEELKKKGDF